MASPRREPAEFGLAPAVRPFEIPDMPPDSPPAAVPAPASPDVPAPLPPGLIELFTAFAGMALAGFGGVLVWARSSLVDR